MNIFKNNRDPRSIGVMHVLLRAGIATVQYHTLYNCTQRPKTDNVADQDVRSGHGSRSDRPLTMDQHYRPPGHLPKS